MNRNYIIKRYIPPHFCDYEDKQIYRVTLEKSKFVAVFLAKSLKEAKRTASRACNQMQSNDYIYLESLWDLSANLSLWELCAYKAAKSHTRWEVLNNQRRTK